MIKVIDFINTEETNIVEFKSLDELFLICLESIVSTVDEDYNEWIIYYLKNPDEVANLPIAKKISEVEATGYEILDDNHDACIENNICQICGNNSSKAYLTIVGNKKFSTCINCI